MLHTIHFLCPVNTSTVSHLQAVCLQSLANGASSLQIHISSIGGELLPGFTAYNFIKSLPIPTITHNISNVESISNLIFMAGDKRKSNPGARFLIHPLGISGQGVVDHTKVLEWAKCLENDLSRFIEIFNQETLRSDVDWAAIINCSTLITPAVAVELGIAHSVERATLKNSSVNWWVTT
jgi:ATP-dependent protease ClpP protease subunit